MLHFIPAHAVHVGWTGKVIRLMKVLKRRDRVAGHEWEHWEYCYYSCTTMRTVLSIEALLSQL